ncbi:hypothetical protein MPER_02589, partial [Moniliophthora perniciosa FA553]
NALTGVHSSEVSRFHNHNGAFTTTQSEQMLPTFFVNTSRTSLEQVPEVSNPGRAESDVEMGSDECPRGYVASEERLRDLQVNVHKFWKDQSASMDRVGISLQEATRVLMNGVDLPLLPLRPLWRTLEHPYNQRLAQQFIFYYRGKYPGAKVTNDEIRDSWTEYFKDVRSMIQKD